MVFGRTGKRARPVSPEGPGALVSGFFRVPQGHCVKSNKKALAAARAFVVTGQGTGALCPCGVGRGLVLYDTRVYNGGSGAGVTDHQRGLCHHFREYS